MSTHPSELEFDLALLAQPSDAFTTHLGSCADCQSKLDSLKSDLQTFRAGDEPVRAARIVTDKRAQRSFGARLRRWLWLPTLATAAVALVAVVARPTPEIRTKGGPLVSVYVERNGRAVPWDGTPLHEGDAVQLGVGQGGDGSRVSVFAVDPTCKVTREHEQAMHSTTLIAASWTLRGPEGGERLYAALSKRAVDADAVHAALLQRGGCTGTPTPDLEGEGFVARGFLLRPVSK